MTAGPDLDFRALPDIARDRSPAGRARLFAFLANLLVARWDRLSSGERTQLAELIAVLWVRGTLIDQQRLATHFAGRAEIPPALQALIGLPGPSPETVALPASTRVAAAPAAAASPEPPPKKKVTITVTQHPIVIRHKRMAPPPAMPIPTPADSAVARGVAGEERGHGDGTREPPLSDQRPSTHEPAPHGASPGVSPAQLSRRIVSPRDEHRENDAPGYDALLASTLLHAAPDRMTVKPAPEGEVPQLHAPRDNPHRLTPELLGSMLATGDQARFEVMLASLAGLRAPLLRRMLRDSGDEAFAILARSVGMDEASFVAQWQIWQQGQAAIGRLQAPADRSRRKRIGAFFAALTEHQISRLVQRWRGSDGRVFAASTTSS
ncbi:MAG TPA: DUF2336 domain-containing protein [Dongiaceae bacterium]|nr:DUF2336 domain-containing protein [Dongiaceae bacterium]